ncbi:MAG: DegT/DnrJ/EryC1/StrS family aminotransferase [Anaerolineae bacterium]|nr:DegT/DnrJ/EryC1/StrS family aminotransferase [Anaerolineae bacterium]
MSDKLAIEGGSPVRQEPFPTRIQIDEREIEAVLALLRRVADQGGAFDRYGGTEVDAYEQEFAAHVGTRFGTATSSGTAAIHSALGALRLDIGSEVISAPITDPGAVMPIIWSNCIPIFADVDPETVNMDPQSVAERITDRTRAIIVCHLAGQPADIDPIMELAARHNLYVIEDCAQAHDAEYKGRKVGSIGHLAAFSLMSGKHSTAGGQGGMVLTNDEELYWNAKRFADRGKPFNSDETSNLFLGMNYRMTELQGAIGRVQLEKLPEIVNRRRRAVEMIRERTDGLQAIRLGKVIKDVNPSYWFLFLRVYPERLRVPKADVAAALRAEGLPVSASYAWVMPDTYWMQHRATYGESRCPWVCPYYGREVSYEGKLPNAHLARENHMTLAVHECYGEKESEDIAAALRKVEGAYLK